MKYFNINKILHRLFHIPSLIIVTTISFLARTIIAIDNFWFMHKDSIKWRYAHLVRDIKFLIPQVIDFVVKFALCSPILLAFCILMIKLS